MRVESAEQHVVGVHVSHRVEAEHAEYQVADLRRNEAGAHVRDAYADVGGHDAMNVGVEETRGDGRGRLRLHDRAIGEGMGNRETAALQRRDHRRILRRRRREVVPKLPRREEVVVQAGIGVGLRIDKAVEFRLVVVVQDDRDVDERRCRRATEIADAAQGANVDARCGGRRARPERERRDRRKRC